MPRWTKGPLQRFWEKVSVSGGPDACWPWKAGRHTRGYGLFSISGVTYRANRLAFVFSSGRGIPIGKMVRHTCDNPCCCNPRHLVLGTSKDNASDMAERGRADGYKRKGTNHPMSKLTEDDVIEIRTLWESRGITMAELARRFGTTWPNISHIVHRRSWEHI